MIQKTAWHPVPITPEIVLTLRHALKIARLVAADYAASGHNGASTVVADASEGYDAAEAWLDSIAPKGA